MKIHRSSFTRRLLRSNRDKSLPRWDRTTAQLGVSRSTDLLLLARISRRPIGVETARRAQLRAPRAVHRALGLTPVKGGPSLVALACTHARFPLHLSLSHFTHALRGTRASEGRWHGACMRVSWMYGACRVTSGANFKTDLNGLASHIRELSRIFDVCLVTRLRAVSIRVLLLH